MSAASAEYPCGVCKLEVMENDSALQCKGVCQYWFHCDCIGISDEEYSLLLSTSSSKWECSKCIQQNLPKFNSIDAVDVFHFDFQKTLPTPKLSVGQQFYLRLLWTYIFGVYSASCNVMIAFMWHEMLAKRGANNVVSCLSHFIFKTKLGRTGAKRCIWWADNYCPGQNKNNCVVWFFQYLIQLKVYTSIDYKFLIPGHTYGPADRNFAIIEKYAAKLENVYTPTE